MSCDTWVNLSDEGKKELGHIFPEGKIPSKSILSEKATLEGQQGTKTVYRIDISELTNEQFEKCIDFIMSKNRERGIKNVPKSQIKRELKELGFIPLQSKYVCGGGTTNVAMFL